MKEFLTDVATLRENARKNTKLWRNLSGASWPKDNGSPFMSYASIVK